MTFLVELIPGTISQSVKILVIHVVCLISKKMYEVPERGASFGLSIEYRVHDCYRRRVLSLHVAK